MISATLTQAAADVRARQRQRPDVYAGHHAELVALASLMETAARRLASCQDVRLLTTDELRRVAEWLDDPTRPFPA